MNIIELVKDILLQFPKINEVCNEIHVDFTDDTPTNYGLSSTGDSLISEDLLGNQTRQHNFVLYAVYQSMNEYDRLSNSGVLIELALWLENQVCRLELEIKLSDRTLKGRLRKLSTANGMLYNIPNENLTDGVQYQLQIIAQYELESEVF